MVISRNRHTKIAIIAILVLTIALVAMSSTVNATSVNFVKTHSPVQTSFDVGNTITFTATLTVTDVPGGSPISITHLIITDTLPAGLTYVVGSQSSNPASSFSIVGNVLTWDFGTATVLSTAPQATVTFQATVDQNAVGYLQNQVSAD